MNKKPQVTEIEDDDNDLDDDLSNESSDQVDVVEIEV